MYQNKVFSTARLDVYSVTTDMAEAFQSFLLRNKERLAPFEPLRGDDYYELENIRQRIQMMMEDEKNQRGISFMITEKDSSTIIGNINFSNFVMGVFQACHLGFSVDGKMEGKGVMFEALTDAMQYIKTRYGLHRVMANHLVTNKRSSKLLKRLGFVREGYAESYLKINGEWQDHILNAYVFEDH
ncbi:GNAT family N-acetyltransferase [Gynuella sunshinyii]|uniref:Acetyltransferase, including N-acetylase of ribosomal protein n=1 Tax=Gynuella sunshinyii YC6258 TaxID=1445510 RepID=A0A0C5VS42_9GAMM|nr:GNAT family N-acetyltransferase [Gynuella sunshinyii]AJQ97477.1 acetyltransferase, including N-acetylase of ribosomal protein [Gynuella sunshinyii YC6258]